MRIIGYVFVAAALFACSSAKDPKVKADFENICNARELSGAADIEDSNEQVLHMAGWLRENVQTNKAKALLESLGSIRPAKRGATLREAAKSAGVEPCKFADES